MSKESTRQPFWNPIYKTLSTNLLIPLENSESPLIQNQIEDSNMLSIKELTLPEKNQPVDPFTFVDFPEPETEKVIKCVKIELYPAHYQKKIFKKWLNTARYVYNKVVNETEKKKSKKYQDFKITTDRKLCKEGARYFLIITLEVDPSTNIKHDTYCGVDLGLRDFLTV
ncbi:hypothetical protein HDU92_008383 [Lobulomyces angularis]|nr:hypothetical protein HDU92_008383 [Lobulomyces angularis]